MNIMFAGLGDLCEDASDELENIEGLSVGQLEQGLVVRGFAVLLTRTSCRFTSRFSPRSCSGDTPRSWACA